jgi:hypothetical protein
MRWGIQQTGLVAGVRVKRRTGGGGGRASGGACETGPGPGVYQGQRRTVRRRRSHNSPSGPSTEEEPR